MYKKKASYRKPRFEDVDILNKRITEESPSSGNYLYDYKLEQAQQEIKSL